MELYQPWLAKTSPISYPAGDGLKIHGYLTLPAFGEKPFPTVVLAHGGPHLRDNLTFDPEVQWLANRGYAVLQINFRGSSGYGKKFLEAGDGEWGRKMQTDLLDGKNWAVRQGYADANRAAIFGASYGGYAVLAALAFAPREFVCGVDCCGMSNLTDHVKGMRPALEPWKPSMMMRKFGPLISASDVEKEQFLRERSPFFHADKIERPLLIAQGGKDIRVTEDQSAQIAAALQARGVSVEYLFFPDEGHWFVKPDNELKFYAAAEAFLALHLGGRSEPT